MSKRNYFFKGRETAQYPMCICLIIVVKKLVTQLYTIFATVRTSDCPVNKEDNNSAFHHVSTSRVKRLQQLVRTGEHTVKISCI